MEEKTLLINSMEKLIKYFPPLGSHIVVSRKNQEEIFASLSRNDFKKIISNLEDENQSTPLPTQDSARFPSHSSRSSSITTPPSRRSSATS